MNKLLKHPESSTCNDTFWEPDVLNVMLDGFKIELDATFALGPKLQIKFAAVVNSPTASKSNEFP